MHKMFMKLELECFCHATSHSLIPRPSPSLSSPGNEAVHLKVFKLLRLAGLMSVLWFGKVCTKVMEGISGQQGISGHGPSFRSLGAVFNNCTALESLKVGYACALTIVRKNC